LDLLDVEENEMDKEKEMRRKNKYNSKGYKDDDDDDDEDVFDEWIKSKLENIIEEDVQTNIQTIPLSPALQNMLEQVLCGKIVRTLSPMSLSPKYSVIS
ncbi:MAG: hypothetical protein EZS28_011724, partial [Streblomastix strix]